MANQKVRLGIIGCGFMSQVVHIPCFLRNERCDIAGVVDVDKELSKKVANKFGIIKCFNDMEEMISDKNIDAIGVIVPPQLMADLSMKCLENKKHVFVEKPLAFRVEEGEKVRDIAKKNNKTIMVGYMKQYDTGVQYVKNFISNEDEIKKFGKMTYARVHSYNGEFRNKLSPEYITPSKQISPDKDQPYFKIPDFVKESDKNRYACSFGNFSHDIDLMRYLIGDPKTVYASHHSKGPNDWLSFSNTIFEYENFIATLETGGVECVYWDENVQIYFEKGWIKLEFPPVLLRDVPAKVSVFHNETGITEPVLGWEWNFQKQADHFIDCIADKKKPISDVNEIINDILIGEAWYRSFLEGKQITI
jgi:predicted dehydrogenase